MDGFAAVFEELEDPRTGNAKRHELLAIRMIALGTLLSGATTCPDTALFGRASQDFLREFLTLRPGIPSHDTFSRVFRLPDPAPFRRCFRAFRQRFAKTCRGVVALDGKTLRRAADRAAAASPLHLVSAWALEQRLVLGQRAVDGKANGITAVPQLLALLALEGTVVTAAALNCQRAIARQVIERGGDDVLALKGNQGTLHDDVRLVLADPATPVQSAGSVDGAHGRIEARRAALSTDIGWLQERHGWPGLAAVGQVTARRDESGGRVTVRTRYHLLSRAFAPERFGAIVRARWDIGNGLHWVLGVPWTRIAASVGRGRRCIRTATARTTAPRTSRCCRRRALNLAKLEPSKGSLRGKLKRAGSDNRFLARMLAQFASPEMR